MASHLALMVLFASFVSAVLATLMRDEPRDQLRFGLRLLGGFVVVGLAFGWLMYALPL